MKISRKSLLAASCVSIVVTLFSSIVVAQDRPRIVKTISARPMVEAAAAAQTDASKSASSELVKKPTSSQPVLTNEIEIARPLVKKTGSSSPIGAMTSLAAAKSVYAPDVASMLLGGIKARFGLPYVYGSSGPNSYDCSGFVWSVFGSAGIGFDRQNVRSLWASSEEVTGDERFKFGTLVFLNNLGHMGIVADENGFYHASSSKGVTYSPFKGYWQNRIVGFKRLKSQPLKAK